MRGNKTRALKEVAQIRGLQRLAAEALASRAAAMLQTKIAVVDESKRERAAAQGHWRREVEAPSLRLDVMQLWSRELLRLDGATARAAADAELAAGVLARCSADWHAASNRDDSAQASARRASRAEAAARDDIVLQDALDRHAYRGRED